MCTKAQNKSIRRKSSSRLQVSSLQMMLCPIFPDDTKNDTGVETEKVLLELFPRQNSQTINLLGLTGNENQPFKSKRGNTLKGGISRENETTIKDEK